MTSKLLQFVWFISYPLLVEDAIPTMVLVIIIGHGETIIIVISTYYHNITNHTKVQDLVSVVSTVFSRTPCSHQMMV